MKHFTRCGVLPPAATAGLVAVFVAVASTFVFGPAVAQNTLMQEIINRLDRLQREVSMLQRDVYQSGSPKQAGGESTAADKGTATITLRQTRLEKEIMNLTGEVEVLGHQLGQLRALLEGLTAEVARMATRPSIATGAGDAARPDPTVVDSGASPPEQPRGTGVLGTIPGRLAVTSPQGAPAGSPATSGHPAPRLAAADQYQRAVALIQRKQDFVAAETALRTLISEHPEHKLASSAWYWLGRTHFVRKQYRKAAFAFADGYKKHPKGTKAADNLFNLGISLAQLKRRKEACTAYSQLLSRFPDVDERMKRRVAREQARNECS